MLEHLLKGDVTVKTQSGDTEGTTIYTEFFSGKNFNLYDTRGFQTIDATIDAELKQILNGQTQPGAYMTRQSDLDKKEGANQVPEFDENYHVSIGEQVHGLILIAKLSDTRVKQGTYSSEIKNFKDYCRNKSRIEPICILMYDVKRPDKIDYNLANSLGIPEQRVFLIKNYVNGEEDTVKGRLQNMDYDTQLQVLEALETALLTAERSIKLRKPGIRQPTS